MVNIIGLPHKKKHQKVESMMWWINDVVNYMENPFWCGKLNPNVHPNVYSNSEWTQWTYGKRAHLLADGFEW